MRPGKLCRQAIVVTAISLAFVQAIALGGSAPLQQSGSPPGPSRAAKEVRGKVAVDQGSVPRFTLPLVSPGGAAVQVAINPQTDGTFMASLPLGVSVVGQATVPNGFTIKSLAYGDKDLLREALTVATSDNAELLIVLSAPRLGSVSGRVTGLKSTEGVHVILRNNTPGVAFEAPINPDGSFTLRNVVPGFYLARVSYGGIPTSRAITLRDADITDLVLDVSRERVLLGHVIVENGVTPDVAVEARGAAGLVVSSTSQVAGRGSDIGKSFLLRMPEGEYRLSIPSVPAGYRVRSMTYGLTDLLKDPLKLDGLGLWEIVVRLDPIPR